MLLAEPWLGFGVLATLTPAWVEEGTSPIPRPLISERLLAYPGP
jgi:hypothetical protein